MISFLTHSHNKIDPVRWFITFSRVSIRSISRSKTCCPNPALLTATVNVSAVSHPTNLEHHCGLPKQYIDADPMKRAYYSHPSELTSLLRRDIPQDQ